MSTRLQDLQARRDAYAVSVFELEQQLDNLTGLEALEEVQAATDKLAAGRRLLTALDRQIENAQAALREEARAERESRRTQAAQQAQKIDADMRRLLLQLFDLAQKRVDATGEFMELAGTSAAMQGWTITMLRAVGVDFETSGLGKGIQPVRR